MSDTGAAQAANDIAVTDDKTVTTTDQTTDTGATEGGEPELDDDGNPVVRDETEELEWDGKKWVLPKDAVATLKPALLRQGDYTKKTQEIADARRALDADREGFSKQTEAQKTHFQAATKLAGLDERLGEYAKVNWQELYQANPDLYQQHRIAYDQLKDQRDAVARDFSDKERQRAENENRERGNQVQKVQAEIARLIPEWTPGNDVDLKLTRYGTDLGLSKEDMAHAILRNPKFALIIKQLHDYDEAAKKQKTQQTFQKTQQAAPVTRVGGNGGSANQRKTTDSSGDALSDAEWAKREMERTRKKA